MNLVPDQQQLSSFSGMESAEDGDGILSTEDYTEDPDDI
jgi:hypothetical protein